MVLACGGFEANAQWRAQYLGAPWDHAKVRGTAHNQGDGLRMALEAGALPRGQWSGRHSTPISNEWPDFADRKRTDKSNRLSYPFGVMVNRAGRRFVDEGEDLGFYTYAKYGGEILRQPGSLAWQIFDAKTTHLLEGRYRTSDPITSDTLEGLVAAARYRQPGAGTAHPRRLQRGRVRRGRIRSDHPGRTRHRWNRPAQVELGPSPRPAAVRRLLGHRRASPSPSAGLAIDESARVLGTDWRPMPGLFTCGEMVGGLFHFNYPGGTGLVSGAVFGRIAGRTAVRDRAGG